jgi:hypothetical protein
MKKFIPSERTSGMTTRAGINGSAVVDSKSQKELEIIQREQKLDWYQSIDQPMAEKGVKAAG